ncbi:hypothetical protein ACOX9L_07230 [Enterococcus durans]|uniref:hypothetical protein n=1 Tax=Enterococcus durans TaxID=53345 RepID=UPI0012FE6369|nr:hypothetical protein [Enterococcus durans]MCB8506170.1 hypothetical protein [Enterococcus durans]MCB8516097.1 hypothetical protein [Enterococcus durans]
MTEDTSNHYLLDQADRIATSVLEPKADRGNSQSSVSFITAIVTINDLVLLIGLIQVL